ncbi:MAG: EAL domain-containing protein [Boseongicola sp.]|nr:MAG: EAL domain-containing protein [Boseongicola sp.]
MTLDDIIASFPHLTGDSIAIGFRAEGEPDVYLQWVNGGYVHMFGYSSEEAIGQPVSWVHDPEHGQDFVAQVRPKFDAGERVASGETYCWTKSGERIWTSVMIFVVPVEGGRYNVALYRDHSALKGRELAAEAALSERDSAVREHKDLQSRLIAAINAVPDPLAIWDSNFRLVVCNRAFSPRILGRKVSLPAGTRVEDVLRLASYSGQFAEAVGNEENWATTAIADVRNGPIRHTTRFSDGAVHSVISHHPPNGDTLVLSVNITDLENEKLQRDSYAKQLEQANELAQFQSLHDELTGLKNRRHLAEALQKNIQRRAREGGHIAVLHIDLDRFKQINDTRGHAVGDSVLQTVADRISDVIQDSDDLARIGGDEFVVLRYCETEEDIPTRLGTRIVEVLSKPILHGGKELRIGASVGIAATTFSEQDDLLTDSDIALYKAKSTGRGCVCLFEQADFDAMARTKQLSDEVLRALECREFVPFYQVQVDAATKSIVGLEALARWQHPDRGIVMPDEFLPIAEDLNVVDQIDQMIFDMALQEGIERFADDFAPALSFNVSHKRLMSRDLINAAERAKLYRGGVSFELLESIFLDDTDESARLQLDALRDSGVQIEVDDFGSGHASIIALEQVAPHRLKIDRRLVSSVTASRRSAGMVQAIVSLGRSLDIAVTAEGVETRRQADLLHKLGCDRLQGFYFGRPKPMSKIVFETAWEPGASMPRQVDLGF